MVKGKPLLPSGASKDLLFDTTEDLNGYLETPKAKAGQFVKVLERNKLGQSVYQTYVIQDINNVFVPQKVSSDIDFSDLDLKIVDDENDETKKYLVLGDDSDDETEYARVVLPAMGGGGGSYVVMRLRNLLPSTTFTVPYNESTGCSCPIIYNWSSIDTGVNNDPTGNGTAYYYVDNVLMLTTQNLSQGNVNVDLGEYLTPNKQNTVKVTVVDNEGNRKNLVYYVTVAYNYISSDFAALSVQTGAFSIPYTPNGSGNKVIYCVIDGDTEHQLTYQTNKSAQTFYFDITGLTHGGHLIELYMSTLLDGQSERVTSNVLTFSVVMISSDNPVLFTEPVNTSIQQYSYNKLNFVTHSSNQQNTVSVVVDKWVETDIPISVIEINGSNINCITVANATTYEITIANNAETVTSGGISYYRISDTNVVVYDTKKFITTQEYMTSLTTDTDEITYFPYRFMDYGVFGVTLIFGEIHQLVVYTVEKVDVAKAEMNGLKYLFDPSNRSNKEDVSTRSVHSYTNSDNETYTAIFNGIDFEIYGWTGTSLKIPHGGSVTIPYQPFLTDTDVTKGKTIEFSFKIRNVYDYSQNLISCVANDMGINILANKGSFVMGASSAVEVQYVEDEEIRLSFVIAKRNSANDYRSQLVYVFVNSILSGVFQYGQADNFVQNPAAGITLGSNYAELELYKIRCYDIELFNVQQGNTSRSYKILNNFIADSPNVDDMIERDARNNIFDDSNLIDSSLLPDNCPYMLIESAALPSGRTDEYVVNGYFVDKANPSKAFIFFNAKIKTQGTSSLDYFIKNFKITFKNGVLFETNIVITSVEIDGEDVDCVLGTDISTYGVTLSNNAEAVSVTNNGEIKNYYKVSDTNIVTENGINYLRVGKYQLFADSIPTNKFCLKADVASSEGANNTVLMKIWDDITRALYNYGKDTLTPPQLEDERIRQSIDSRPMVLYWRDISNPNNPVLKFWGKYNFNNDKGTHEVYGFNSTKYPDCQCWEFRDNGKVLSQFKSIDFDTLVPYTNKKTQRNENVPRWYETFEPRFPEIDDEQDAAYTQVDSTLLTKFKRVLSWVYSTDTTQANSSVTLANSVEYDGVTYTTDSVEYRLAKFKNEFTDYFKKDLTLLYYIFTDIFLLADNREKNQFITTFDGIHWFFIPYDGDTALGINNSGKYGFEYWLEGDSVYNGANVYNGRPSVLWNNIATVFAGDIQTLCRALLSCDIVNRDNSSVSRFNFEYVRDRFDQYQNAWSEAIFCADAEHKYIIPYIETADPRYLSMAQGSKRLQREYWLKNRFIYWCSKYMIGDSTDITNGINIRMSTPEGMSDDRYVEVYNPCGNPSTSYYYEKSGNTYFSSTDTSVNNSKTYYVKWNTLVVTSLTNTYILVGTGQNLIPYRCNANESIAAKGTLDSNGDSPLNFYNASEIKNVGDLSQSYVSNFSIGTNVKNLESIVIGSENNDYENTAITQLSTSSCEKLKTLNISNCKNLGTGNVKYIDISKCFNIREVLAKGTQITAVNLARGSQIRTLKLPNTIRNLELINQTQLITFEMEGYTNLRTLTVQNTPVDILSIINSATNLTTINIYDVDWTFNDGTGIEILNMLADKSAILSNTVNVSGRISVPEINSAQYNRFTTLWRGLTITCSHFIQQYPITFKNYDGTELGVVWVNDGETTYANITINKTTGAYHLASTGEKLFDKPTRPYSWNKTFEFENVWDRNLTTAVHETGEYVAQFTETDRVYNVQFKVGNVIKQSIDVTAGDTVAYDISNGKPNKEGENNTWYLCKGWTDTGEEIYRSSIDVNHIFGLYSTLELNESMLSDFVATIPTVVKPTFVLNAIFDECGLPDSLPLNPQYEDVRAYLANYDYVYTNDPNYTSAYTLPELHAISMSDKFNLYLEEGDKMRIYFPSNGSIGGDIYGSGHDVAIMEVLGFNVYEREDSDFGEYNGTIIGAFTSIEDVTELVGKQAGLYICNSNGNVYYWDGTALTADKVTQYFSHVVWGMALGDNAANNASGKKYRHMMDTQFRMNSSNQTINGWGDDNASTNKKCELNALLNDGLSGGRSIFSTFPSELQPIITPVKVISAKGAYYPEGSSSLQFSPAPVTSVSRLFISCYGELWGTTGTPYINEINKWASICKRDSSDNVTKINRYPKIVSNNTLIARKFLGTGTDVMNCWTRSAYSTTNFVIVLNGSGNSGNIIGASDANGVPLCFCTG